MERISVIVTSYNQKADLKEAIESVLNQTHRPFEIIVSDDASTDSSPELIRRYEQEYPGLVKGVFHAGNQGISKNRNSGLKAASGELVAWLDGDDIFMPRKLEFELRRFREVPEARWIYSQVLEVDVENKSSRPRYGKMHEGRIFDHFITCMGQEPRNPLVERELFKEIGLFDEEMDLYEDFDLCLRLSKNYDCACCPEPLMEYRIHSGGVHNSGPEKYAFNLHRLHGNLLRLIEDEDEGRRRAIERRFLKSMDYILLQIDIEAGRTFAALSRLFKAVVFNPMTLLSPKTYVSFLAIILPKSVIRVIREARTGARI
jgi:glycosyltransferase involved in cell wall biosynthesis